MADIELVIKIPEEVYKQFKEDQKQKYVSAMISTDIIANGIPLPKGHGRLIDVDTLEFRNVTVSYGYDWECGESTYAEEEVICADDIWNAQPIIEADKTESEK